jgi:hypothetical protein
MVQWKAYTAGIDQVASSIAQLVIIPKHTPEEFTQDQT